jgi:hypothetical protein
LKIILVTQKQGKEYGQTILKRPEKKFNGVFEFCFSVMKFKGRLEHEGIAFSFNLEGIKTMMSDKKQPIFGEYAKDALNYA